MNSPYRINDTENSYIPIKLSVNNQKKNPIKKRNRLKHGENRNVLRNICIFNVFLLQKYVKYGEIDKVI